MTKRSSHINYTNIYPLFSGILLGLPWNGFSGTILFIAWIPLFYYFEQAILLNKKGITIFFSSLLCCGIWNLLATWWSVQVTPLAVVATVFVNGGLMSVVLLLFYKIRKWSGSNLGYIYFVFIWIAFEYLQYNWDLNFPWLTLGNAFSNDILLVQWYEYSGVLGGSLWILVVNILFFRVLNKNIFFARLRLQRLSIILLISFLVIPIAASLLIFDKYNEKKSPVTVLVMQPNIDPYTEKFNTKETALRLQNYFLQIKKTDLINVDFVVAPETILTKGYFIDSISNSLEMSVIQDFIRGNTKTSMIFGANTFQTIPENNNNLSVRFDSTFNRYYEAHNSSLATDSKGNLQIYHKSKLFPGTEKTPFGKYMRFLKYLTINIGGISGDMGIQESPSVFYFRDSIIIAPIICWESIFGSYTKSFVEKGANAIFIITNDGWWRNTPGTLMHNKVACLRAIETRRSIVRSANTGISAIIDQKGVIQKSIAYGKSSYINATINLNNEVTFYTMYGDYIGVAGGVFCGLILLSIGLHSIRFLIR